MLNFLKLLYALFGLMARHFPAHEQTNDHWCLKYLQDWLDANNISFYRNGTDIIIRNNDDMTKVKTLVKNMNDCYRADGPNLFVETFNGLNVLILDDWTKPQLSEADAIKRAMFYLNHVVTSSAAKSHFALHCAILL